MQFSTSPIIICIVSLLVDKCLAQRDGDLRLVNGTTSSEGRVEMYFGTRWMAISNQRVGRKIAIVVCRQLGFPIMRSEAVVNAFGRDVKPRLVLVPNAICDGSEDRLVDCNAFSWNQRLEDAHIDHDIGVICKAGDGDLRLVNGKNANEGLVELYYENMWNTLSGGSFTPARSLINFPTLVCRQLRLPFTEAQTITDVNVFGPGTGRVLRTDVSCKPGDTQLMDCKLSNTEVSTEASQHDEDVGVICKGEYIANGEVRLVNGSNNLRGRLEIYLTGAWSSFCSIGFTVNEATVACRQLGLDTSQPVVLADNYFANSSRPDRSYFAGCNGYERRFIHCPSLFLSSSSSTWEDIYCGDSPHVSICCSNETVSCGSSDIGVFISGVLPVVLTLIGFCLFFCCCCWCWRRNKRREQHATVSQNSHPQATAVRVQGSDLNIYVHSHDEQDPVSGHTMGVPPPQPAASSTLYTSQPYSYPVGKAPPPTNAYPVPHQPGHNPTAAANQYPPQPAAPYPPQTSSMEPPYDAPYQPSLSLYVPSAPQMDGGNDMHPLTPPPPYEEIADSHLEQ